MVFDSVFIEKICPVVPMLYFHRRKRPFLLTGVFGMGTIVESGTFRNPTANFGLRKSKQIVSGTPGKLENCEY